MLGYDFAEDGNQHVRSEGAVRESGDVKAYGGRVRVSSCQVKIAMEGDSALR